MTDDRQISKRLPRVQAHSLLLELMHKGYDTMCSELDDEDCLTVTWPASLNIGKQLYHEKNRGE